MTPTAHFLDHDTASACIHCGLCLPSCPTYLETGNENDSPRGRIYLMRALDDGRIGADDGVVRHIDLCLGCRACEAVCPSGVKYGELLEGTREFLRGDGERQSGDWRSNRSTRFNRSVTTWMIEHVLPYPKRLWLALMPARLLRWLPVGWLLPRFVREMLALLPEDLQRQRAPEFSAATSGESRGTVALLEGCVMQTMFGATNAATISLINDRGYDVATPAGQVCCGALFAHGGNLERARELARANIAAFEKLHPSAIVVNAAGCGSMMKEYGSLLTDDPDWSERASIFSRNVKDLTEWLVDHTASGPPATTGAGISPRGVSKPVNLIPMRFTSEAGNLIPMRFPCTMHDACHLAHAQGITAAPRILLRTIASDGEIVELPESDVCCGSAGSYNITEPEMAARLRRRKVERILESGAKTVITTNPGCILQIRAGLLEAGAGDIEVLHIADALRRSAVV